MTASPLAQPLVTSENITEYVYVMAVGPVWHTRTPGNPEAKVYSSLDEAVAAGREFAWLRQCVGGRPTVVRIRHPDGSWTEIDHAGQQTLLPETR